MAQSGHFPIARHAIAFDATWALGLALSYTELMRMQIITVNGALNDSNCSSWNGKICADLSQLFHEKCSLANRICTAEEGFRAETYCISSFCLLCLCSKRRLLANIVEKNASLTEIVKNAVCDYCNVSHLMSLSTADIIYHANSSREGVVRIFQDCMVEELVQYTNCEGMDGGLVPLDEFNYSNSFMGCVIRYHLLQTDFIGVSVSKSQNMLVNHRIC